MAGVSGRTRRHNTKQADFFSAVPSVQTMVISRRRDFEALFDGFTSLRAISYVVSPDLLLEFLDARGYTAIEVLVGENFSGHALSESYRQGLAQKDVEVTERLAKLVDSGALSIFIPDRTIHTKLYILEGVGSSRVIISSANFTETARQATRQVNYAWYADLPADHPLLQQVVADYRSHTRGCFPFMGDLTELIRQSRDGDRRELIEVWLKGGVIEEADLETQKFLQQISVNALEASKPQEEPVFTVRLPEEPRARKQAERFLAPLHPLTAGNEVRVNGPAFIRHVQEVHGLPLMRVDLEHREVRLGIDGSVNVVTEPLPEHTSVVGDALEHIEDYLDTVELGQAPNPQFAKTSMFEALLYTLSAPFAHEYMKLKRRSYGVVDTRGPRLLYIYGPSQNGKTTFLRFALKTITGHHIQPFSKDDFTKTKIVNAASIGTAFPLAFDDVVPRQHGVFEQVLKSYWEVWWGEEYVSPQIIMSSNTYTLMEWAKSRVKRVDFDVHFPTSEANKRRLATILTTENPIFRWFSYLYFRHLMGSELPSDDELLIARIVMKELYDYAGRRLPEYFPNQPIEKLYDPGRRAWREILYQLKKADVHRQRDRISVEFREDMQHSEVKEYESYLPQTVKCRKRGKTLIIESPQEFNRWLEGQSAQRRGLFSRLFKK